MASSIPLKSKIGYLELFKISLFKEVIKPTVPHRHAGYFELIVLFDGAGEHLIDDSSYEVAPPVVFFLRPGQTHCWNFSRIPKGYVLLFRESLLHAADLSICYQMPTHMQLPAANQYHHILQILLAEQHSGNTQTELISAYLHLLLTKLSLLGNENHSVVHSPLYHRFKSLLVQPGRCSGQVSDHAAKLGVSVQQLSRACRAAIGRPPSQILAERILLDAKVLLGSTTEPIKHIAYELGFTDTSHFVKFFKSATNLTPGDYREQAARYRDRY